MVAAILATLLAVPPARAEPPGAGERRVGPSPLLLLNASSDDVDRMQVVTGAPPRDLQGAALFEELGRPDLARAYVHRSRLRRGLRGTGAALLGAAVIAAFVAGASAAHCSPQFGGSSSAGGIVVASRSPDACAVTGPALGSAVAALVAGVALVVGARFVRKSPVDATTLRGLVRDHNEREASLGSVVTWDDGGLALRF